MAFAGHSFYIANCVFSAFLNIPQSWQLFLQFAMDDLIAKAISQNATTGTIAIGALSQNARLQNTTTSYNNLRWMPYRKIRQLITLIALM